MAITPPTTVAGAQHAPLPYGLFSVVPVREDSGDRWLGGGINFETIGGDPGQLKAIAHNCAPDEEGGLPRELEEAGPEWSQAQPFSIFESYQCSPAGNRLERAAEVAQRRLNIREEYRVEQVIAHGAVGLTRTLTGEAEDLGELGEAATAFSELEQRMATAYLSQGILHMSRATATLALAEGVIETASSGRLRTLLHTPVIAGTGYSFEGVIGTPAMFAYRGDVEAFDGAEMFDQRTNDLYAVAERPYLVAWPDLPVFHGTFTVSSGGSGMAGASAYEIAVQNGFEGSEEDWLVSLKGEPGQDGQDGQDGDVGPAPEVTWDGTTIVVDGEPGPDLQGEPGTDGADGDPGTDGIDGVDGIVQAIVGGTGITVDATDPAEPIISASE